jgi:hypothetical protein
VGNDFWTRRGREKENRKRGEKRKEGREKE